MKSELQRLIEREDSVDEEEQVRYSGLSVNLKVSHERPQWVLEKAWMVEELFVEYHNNLSQEWLGEDGKTPHWNASNRYRFAKLEAFCKENQIELESVNVVIFFDTVHYALELKNKFKKDLIAFKEGEIPLNQSNIRLLKEKYESLNEARFFDEKYSLFSLKNYRKAVDRLEKS
jgi:hypothetical protein